MPSPPTKPGDAAELSPETRGCPPHPLSEEGSRNQSLAVGRQCGEYQAGLGCRITQIVEKQYATVRSQITVDQCADIMVLGENDPPFGDRFSKQSLIAWVGRPLA